MTALGETTAPASIAKPSVSRLGDVFRPNGSVTASVYTAVLATWIIIAALGWLILPAIIPNPVRVFEALNALLSDGLIGELWTSLILNIQAITLSTLIALIISYAAAIPAIRPFAIAVGKGRFLPLIGLSFIAVLYVGGGHPLKLTLLTYGLIVFFVTSMVDVVLQVPQETLDYVRTLRAGEWRVLWEARILGTAGQAFDILRQNAAMGWLMLTMVEGLVRSEGGIGRMLLDQEKHFNLPSLFAITGLFLLVGIGQDVLIAWLKSIFAPSSMLAYTKDRA